MDSQTHRRIFLGAGALTIGLLSPFSLSAQESNAKPNIVLILTDEMGYEDPQCFNPQSRIAPLRLIVWPGDV